MYHDIMYYSQIPPTKEGANVQSKSQIPEPWLILTSTWTCKDQSFGILTHLVRWRTRPSQCISGLGGAGPASKQARGLRSTPLEGRPAGENANVADDRPGRQAGLDLHLCARLRTNLEH